MAQQLPSSMRDKIETTLRPDVSAREVTQRVENAASAIEQSTKDAQLHVVDEAYASVDDVLRRAKEQQMEAAKDVTDRMNSIEARVRDETSKIQKEAQEKEQRLLDDARKRQEEIGERARREIERIADDSMQRKSEIAELSGRSMENIAQRPEDARDTFADKSTDIALGFQEKYHPAGLSVTPSEHGGGAGRLFGGINEAIGTAVEGMREFVTGRTAEQRQMSEMKSEAQSATKPADASQ